MTAEQASSHPLRRKGFALATFAAASVGVSAFALAAVTGDLSGGAKISDGGAGLFGMRRAAAAAAGSPASSSSSSFGTAVREEHPSLRPCALACRGTELDWLGERWGTRAAPGDVAATRLNKIDGLDDGALPPSLFTSISLAFHLFPLLLSLTGPRLGLQASLRVRSFPREEQEQAKREPRRVNRKKRQNLFPPLFRSS